MNQGSIVMAAFAQFAAVPVAVVVGSLPAQAYAELSTSHTSAFDFTASVQDRSANFSPTRIQAGGSVGLGLFDPADGVLTHVGVALFPSTRTERLAVERQGAWGPRWATGYVTSPYGSVVSGPGGQGFTLPGKADGHDFTNLLAVVCGDWLAPSCPETATSRSLSPEVGSYDSSDPGVLDAYVGTGEFQLSGATPVGASLGGGSGTATYTVDWFGDAQVAYGYLDHANASFAGVGDVNALTIDFGSFLLENPAVGTLAVDSSHSVYNLGGSDTTAMDWASLEGGGDTSTFSLTGLSFQDLLAGTGKGFSAAFHPTGFGSFSATYSLMYADAASIGAASSHALTGPLFLTLTGSVAAVPEPHEWALMLAGLGVVVCASRRRSNRAVRSHDESPAG